MTPERQKIRIAELQGWKRHSELDYAWVAPWQCEVPLVVDLIPLPDYLNSRDALAPVLGSIPQEQHIAFMRELCFGCRPGTWQDAWCVLTSTPAQLCEAYLRTKGEWEDSAPTHSAK